MPNQSPSNPPPRPIQSTPGGTTPDGPATSTPTNPGGEGGFQPQAPGPVTPIQHTGTDDPDGGGEVFEYADAVGFVEDPDAGGEVAFFAETVGLVEDPDAGGEIAFLADPHLLDTVNLTHPDDGGEVFARFDDIAIVEDPCAGGEVGGGPDGGGPVAAMDGLGLLAQVSHLKAGSASADDQVADDPDGGHDVFLHGGTLGIVEDPDAGGEIAARGRTTVRDSHDRAANTRDESATDDPDGGDEVGFGSGSMPPRPVTMTAADLGIAGDPDGGGEVADDPDGGDEIVRFEEVPEEEEVPMVVDTFEAEPIEPELSDFEVASDFDQAVHSFEPGEV